MPETQAPARAGGAEAAEAGEGRQGKSLVQTLLQMVALYVLAQVVLKQFVSKPPAAETATDASGNPVTVPTNTGSIPPFLLRPESLDEGAVYNPVPQRLAPIWPEDSAVDITIVVSHSPHPVPLKVVQSDTVIFQEKGFQLGNFNDKRTIDTTIRVPPKAANNGTIFGHFYIGLEGSLLDPFEADYDRASAYYFLYPLTQYVPRKREAKTRSLLGGSDDETNSDAAAAAEKEEEAAEAAKQGPFIASYYHPNHTLSFVPGNGIINFASVQPATRQFLHLEATGARDGTGQNSWYYPILFVNTFWQLKDHMTQLNDTVKTLPVHIDLGNLSPWKFNIMSSIELNGREARRQAAFGHSLPGGGDGTEIEMIKEILLDTNPILLAVTSFATIAHLILETLAFGSDIAHYRKKKDNVGVSVRSILASAFMSTVIFLYLLDNSQNTSWMILGSQAVGILIELWKITTVVDVRVRDAPPGSLIPKRIVFEDKHKLSETEQQTQEYDEIAFRYMYIAGVPLLLAYAGYSLVYEEHKSWYSFVITTLVGSVYAYGFLMMVPSLYINYRLKSVAHMPAKAMMYKFLNTFIDDLFAFTIKMPFLHRLATFRDDIIFFIYLYQKWAYRTDYTRVNEFGQGGDDDEDDKAGDEKKDGAQVPKEGEETVGAQSEKASGADKGGATKRK